MPTRPKKICHAPGCGAACDGSYCAAHLTPARRPFNYPRESPTRRGYGRRWEKLRRMVLARQPFCHIAVLCDGTALSTEADHIVPKSKGCTDSLDNLQGACHACHSHKTATEDTSFAARTPPPDMTPFSTGDFALRTAPHARTHTREINLGGVGGGSAKDPRNWT